MPSAWAPSLVPTCSTSCGVMPPAAIAHSSQWHPSPSNWPWHPSPMLPPARSTAAAPAAIRGKTYWLSRNQGRRSARWSISSWGINRRILALSWMSKCS